MSQPNVVPRVNSMIQSMERPYIDLTGSHQMSGAGTHIMVHLRWLKTVFNTFKDVDFDGLL